MLLFILSIPPKALAAYADLLSAPTQDFQATRDPVHLGLSLASCLDTDRGEHLRDGEFVMDFDQFLDDVVPGVARVAPSLLL